MHQEAVRFATRVLDDNGWVHVFPEGRVNQTEALLKCRWGVGQMALDAATAPVVVPVWLAGFHTMLPLKTYVPRPGARLAIWVGEPLDLGPILAGHRAAGADEVGRLAETGCWSGQPTRMAVPYGVPARDWWVQATVRRGVSDAVEARLWATRAAYMAACAREGPSLGPPLPPVLAPEARFDAGPGASS